MRFIPFERKLFEKQGQHHLVQVFERGARRELRFGNHIVQSSYIPDAPDVLQLDYTRAMLMAFVLSPGVLRVLHIGLGGGTLPRFIHRHFPDVQQRIVELSPEVVEAAYACFDLPRSPRLIVWAGNGAEHVRKDRSSYDVIFVDAFTAEGAASEIQQPETLRLFRARLAPGGWLVCNAWGSDPQGLSRLTQDLMQVVPTLFSISVRVNSNVIFFGKVDTALPMPLELMTRARELAREIPLEFHQFVPRLRRVRTGASALHVPL
ncbi:MAG: fused MFS/spermidine synthase [Candidatus Lambdaproteobacteria bacterium]|nr:fused MFS/spermidine synthase [Candidatus Lambdaproteobacteria bacterium]